MWWTQARCLAGNNGRERADDGEWGLGQVSVRLQARSTGQSEEKVLIWIDNGMDGRDGWMAWLR